MFIDIVLVDGVDLAVLIARDGALAPGRAADIPVQAAGALETAHRRGLVHRDIKPADILVAERRGGDLVHLIDFDMSRALGGRWCGVGVPDALSARCSEAAVGQ